MNIFKRKKALLAEIEDLKGQIGVQSREMAGLRKSNTDINRLWTEKKKECATLNKEIDDLKELLRKKGIEHAEILGKANSKICELHDIIDKMEEDIAELQDTNNGLASSVSELKGKLKSKEKRVRELNTRIDDLKSKLKRYTDHEPQPHKD